MTTSVRRSEPFGELAAAMARAQAKMRHPSASQTNPRFGNRYPSLADVIDAVRVPLAEEGISVWTTTDTDPAGRITVTHLFTLADQWCESDITVDPGGGDPQAIGSALTYGRRYGLSAACNIASGDTDDDGETATTRTTTSSSTGRKLTRAAINGFRQRAAADGASSEDLAGWVKAATQGRTDDLGEMPQSDLAALHEARKAWIARPSVGSEHAE